MSRRAQASLLPKAATHPMPLPPLARQAQSDLAKPDEKKSRVKCANCNGHMRGFGKGYCVACSKGTTTGRPGDAVVPEGYDPASGKCAERLCGDASVGPSVYCPDHECVTVSCSRLRLKGSKVIQKGSSERQKYQRRCGPCAKHCKDLWHGKAASAPAAAAKPSRRSRQRKLSRAQPKEQPKAKRERRARLVIEDDTLTI